MKAGFLFTQNRLPQMVDIDADILLPSFMQIGMQGTRFSGNNRTTAALTHLVDHPRDGNVGEVLAETEEHLHQKLLYPGKEIGDPVSLKQTVYLIRNP